jgi:hypothetical protein
MEENRAVLNHLSHFFNDMKNLVTIEVNISSCHEMLYMHKAKEVIKEQPSAISLSVAVRRVLTRVQMLLSRSHRFGLV